MLYVRSFRVSGATFYFLIQGLYYKQYTTVDNSSKLLYTVCARTKYVNNSFSYNATRMEISMKIIINHSSMVPIYEQVVEQIKLLIKKGELQENNILPSVRGLSGQLKISALTVKKAYDFLEEEGYTVTVHGKGTYVAAVNQQRLLEEQKREIEAEFEQSIRKGKRYGLSKAELRELFEIIMEEE